MLIILVGDAGPQVAPKLLQAFLEEVIANVDAEAEITQADHQIRVLNQEDRFEDALQIARAFVARFPNHPRAHFVLAGTFDFQDRGIDAVPSYQRAWDLGLSAADLPRFYVQYGSTLRNVGQLDESVRVLQEGWKRFPDDAAIQAFLALALFSAGRATDALATALLALVQHADAVDLHGYERALREYVDELQPSDTPQ